MEWNNELVLDFLHHYENEPIIWNFSFPNHKDRYAIHEAWKRIENKMDNKFPVSELKRKKDSLMAAFRTLSRKVKASSLNGAGDCDAYRPNWFAYEVMERFLKNKNQHTETLSIEAQHENNEQYEQILELDLTEDLPSGEEDSEQGAEALFLSTPAVPSFKQQTQKRFKASDETEIKKKTDSAYATLQQSHLKTQTERNICDIYGELVAARLKAMDEPTRDICMNRIDNILFEMKMSKGLAKPNQSLIQNQHLSPSTS